MPFKLKRFLYFFQMWKNFQVRIIHNLHWYTPVLLDIDLFNPEVVLVFIKHQGGVGQNSYFHVECVSAFDL